MEVDKACSEATFRFTIHNFSRLEGTDVYVLSPPCYVQNLPWKMKVRQWEKSLSFYLKCNGESTSSSWSCFAEAELRLLSYKSDTQPFVRTFQRLFSSEENEYGFTEFMQLDEVLKLNKGYINSDSITLEVDVSAEPLFKKLKKHSGCEDWRLDCGGIKHRESHILKTKEWSDCSFVVGQHPHQITIKAHKLILAMASPVFEGMFYGPMAEGNYPIPIPDIHPDAFQKMMEYIYTDNIELNSINIAIKLYYSAQKYLLNNLLAVCSEYLLSNITPEVACKIFEFARTVSDENLITKCMLIFKTETVLVLNHKSFADASLETVEKIFKMKSLNITNELDLLKAAEQYADALKNNGFFTSQLDENMNENQNPEGDVTPVIEEIDSDIHKKNKEYEKNNLVPHHNSQNSSNKHAQEQDMRCKSLMRKVVRHIRFLTLSPNQLAKYPTLITTLLTDSEILALMFNARNNPLRPMPEGFSVCRWRRVIT